MKKRGLISLFILVFFITIMAYSAHNEYESTDSFENLPINETTLETLINAATLIDPDNIDIKIEAIQKLGDEAVIESVDAVVDALGYGSTTVVAYGGTTKIYPWRVRVVSAKALADIVNEHKDSNDEEEMKSVELAVDSLADTAMNDEENTVRRAAVQALGMVGDAAQTEDVLTKLHEILARSPDNGLAADICETLGEIKDPASFVPLLRVTQGDFLTYVKEAAKTAISEIDWEYTVFDEED